MILLASQRNLNVNNTKEMVVVFQKEEGGGTPMSILGQDVDVVEVDKYLSDQHRW